MNTLLIAGILLSASCGALEIPKATYTKMVKLEQKQREKEAQMLKEVERLTAARDRAMDAQENHVPLPTEDAQRALNKAMDALQKHQKKLGSLHATLHPKKTHKKRSYTPLSMFEQISGKQFTALHQAEVKELFVAAKKQGLPHESLSRMDILNTLTVSGAPMDICEEAAQHMMARMDADQDGQVSWAESMQFVKDDSAQQVKPMASSMLEKEAAESSTEANAALVEKMKANATMTLMKVMQELEAKEDAKKRIREMRWKNLLERQKASLAERERSLKRQQKELDRLNREEEWQKIEAEKNPSGFVEKKSCAPQDMHAVLTTHNRNHASCLKLQLGECANVAQIETPALLQCLESSKGWQKKCMNERTEQVAECAPAGVNWNALKKGEQGDQVAIDNMAIKKLQGWCTFYNALQKVNASQYEPTPSSSSPRWAVLVDQDATIANDFMEKVSNFARESSSMGLLRIDPEDSPFTTAVRADHAEKILNFMAATPAMPIVDLLKTLGEQQGVGSSELTAGVAGVIDEDVLRSSSVQGQLATNGLLCSPRRM